MKIKITGIPEMKKGGHWLQGAVNPAHKGFCTPMTKSTCTPRRKAFAMTMKKHHGFHKKKDDGGLIPYKEGGWTNTGMPNYNPHVYFRNNNWYNGLGPHDDISITSTMSPIDRDKANLEAERGELIVKPGLTGLYRIGGKKHSQGGTPLFADGGSFIFSNDPKLSIKKHEKEAFSFKKGGSDAMSKNTPAKVLSREVSPLQYNKYMSILQSDKTDDISKTTAALMLEKMQKKIGQVAYLQEAKKRSPIPEFAQGTAPVKKSEFNNIKEIQGQYKYGGYFAEGGEYNMYGNPLPPDKTGKWAGDNRKSKNPRTGATSNTWNAMTDFSSPEAYAKAVGYSGNPQNIKGMQQWIMQQYPDLVDYYHNSSTGYGQPAAGRPDDGKLGIRWQAIAQAIQTPPDKDMRPSLPTPPINVRPPMGGPSITEIGTQREIPTLPYDIKGKLTDSQLANLGYLGLNAMNINTYYPKREQVNLPDVRLDKVSAQPYLNQINNQAYAARQLSSLNPASANINAGNIYGKSLDQASQVLGNINNQNVQIGNQENLTNLQQRTNQVMTNNQLDSRYYDQLQTTKQNADNERRFARNQFVSTLNNYQSQADQLAWGLASVNKYGRRAVTDTQGNVVAYKPIPLYEYTNNGIRYNQDVADLSMATGADKVNSTSEIKRIMSEFGLSSNDPKQIYAFARLFDAISGKGKQPVYMNNPYQP